MDDLYNWKCNFSWWNIFEATLRGWEEREWDSWRERDFKWTGIEINILSFSLTLYVLHLPQSPCFWQEKFISNSVSALCWDVLRPWLQPQSHPRTPTETNHRSRLPSSHGNPVLTTRQLNLRFNMVELSLASQSGELLLSHHCIPQPLLFFSLLFLSAVSCTHHITSFLVHLSSPVMFLLQISTSLNPFFSFVLCLFIYHF